MYKASKADRKEKGGIFILAGKEAAETNAECLAVNAILELFSEGVRRKEAGKERTGQEKRWQRRFQNRSEIRSVFILI